MTSFAQADLLTTAEVAELLDISPGAVRKMVESHVLRAVPGIGLDLLIPRSQIEAFTSRLQRRQRTLMARPPRARFAGAPRPGTEPIGRKPFPAA